MIKVNDIFKERFINNKSLKQRYFNNKINRFKILYNLDDITFYLYNKRTRDIPRFPSHYRKIGYNIKCKPITKESFKYGIFFIISQSKFNYM